MGIQQALKRGQRLEQNLMTDECMIQRRGEETTNPETGVVEPSMKLVYEGPCRLTSATTSATSTTAGENSFVVESPRLHILHGAEVQPGDIAVITSTTTGNAAFGLEMHLVDLQRGTHRTAQRWNVEVVTR